VAGCARPAAPVPIPIPATGDTTTATDTLIVVFSNSANASMREMAFGMVIMALVLIWMQLRRQ
jgi:hypothetical protein